MEPERVPLVVADYLQASSHRHSRSGGHVMCPAVSLHLIPVGSGCEDEPSACVPCTRSGINVEVLGLIGSARQPIDDLMRMAGSSLHDPIRRVGLNRRNDATYP
jgi:hypothetical protein